jgi:hypothetical protein
MELAGAFFFSLSFGYSTTEEDSYLPYYFATENLKFNVSGFHLVSVYSLLLQSCAFHGTHLYL